MNPDAVSDYLFLLDRGYPQAPALDLVGDRYRLDRSARNILRRGIADSASARRRAGRLVPGAPGATGVLGVAGRPVGVDGHNVVLTVANYLAGKKLFIANDGILRDDGALHGRLHDRNIMTRAFALVVEALAAAEPGRVVVVLDRPLSHSADDAAQLQRLLAPLSAPVQVRLEHSADGALRRLKVEVVASADSAVLDAVDADIWDLARFALERGFDLDVEDFGGRSGLGSAASGL